MSEVESTDAKILEIMGGISEDAKLVLRKTIEAEKRQLHMRVPKGVVQDIADEVRRVVK